MEEYKLSQYDKDCLPTWSEIYDEFWMKKVFNYDPNITEHQELDPYWKRPHRKILLAFVCNQLNKMIFEDGIDVLSYINETTDGHCRRIHFTLNPDHVPPMLQPYQPGFMHMEEGPPGIYACRLPSTNEYSIFATNHPKIDIDALTLPFEIAIYAVHEGAENIGIRLSVLEVIEFILKDVITYYENGIGWKDNHGDIIPSDVVSRTCEGMGYDPAL